MVALGWLLCACGAIWFGRQLWRNELSFGFSAIGLMAIGGALASGARP